jgi:hypothetical protein
LESAKFVRDTLTLEMGWLQLQYAATAFTQVVRVAYKAILCATMRLEFVVASALSREA